MMFLLKHIDQQDHLHKMSPYHLKKELPLLFSMQKIAKSTALKQAKATKWAL
jgi:hypothetical protein